MNCLRAMDGIWHFHVAFSYGICMRHVTWSIDGVGRTDGIGIGIGIGIMIPIRKAI